MASNPQPKPKPNLNLPSGSSTCDISIINTTCSLVLPISISVGPPIKGHKWMNCPVYAFHITHLGSGTELLFDLGCRKDWWDLVPQTVELLDGNWPGLKVEKDIFEILEEGGKGFKGDGKTGRVSKVVLSHSHFDHVGDLSKLPKEVEMVVGPGWSEAMMPGYPTNAESTFYEREIEGRNMIEVPFSKDRTIGKFESWDMFEDGSVQILNAPGHAVGHICALIRTTKDSYILLGGDTCHFVGAMRPTEYYPMPEPLPEETFLDKRIPSPCPCSIFTCFHRDQENAQTKPFYDLVSPAFPDVPTSMASLNALAEFDADENVLVVIAHDTAPVDVLSFFPNGSITNWKQKGYKEKMHFHFVNELPVDGRVGREPLVDGIYKAGVKIRTLEGETL